MGSQGTKTPFVLPFVNDGVFLPGELALFYLGSCLGDTRQSWDRKPGVVFPSLAGSWSKNDLTTSQLRKIASWLLVPVSHGFPRAPFPLHRPHSSMRLAQHWGWLFTDQGLQSRSPRRGQ